MIRSHSDFIDASAQYEMSRDRLAKYREELRCKGLSPQEIEIAVGPMVSASEQQHADLACYQRIRAGDLSEFRDLRSLGALLIAARIAKGQSKRDLAEKMGVHESQVSRDERNEYQGISLERVAQILDALGVEIQLQARILPPVEAAGCEPLASFDFDAPALPSSRMQDAAGRFDPRGPAV
jgi:transcriptional regulator with XRE-family HTH domain